LPRLAAGPVITTNFDQILEKVFERAQRPFERLVYGRRDAELGTKALHENRRFLVKIHGDVWNESERVLTSSDYQREYSGKVGGSGIDFSLPLPDLLRQMLVGRPLLFLGCSLNQDRTVALLKQVAQDFRNISAFAVVEQPTSTEEFDKRSQFLASLRIRRIWYPSGRHDLIESLLKELAVMTASSPGVIARQKLEFMQKTQDQQQDEINTLKFLVSHFVTDDEFKHLKKLAAGEPFLFNTSSDTWPFLREELRRLRSFGLIKNFRDRGIRWMMGQGQGDVKDSFNIEKQGRDYLELRDQVDSKTSAQNDDS
jgi:hypothetical protein